MDFWKTAAFEAVVFLMTKMMGNEAALESLRASFIKRRRAPVNVLAMARNG